MGLRSQSYAWHIYSRCFISTWTPLSSTEWITCCCRGPYFSVKVTYFCIIYLFLHCYHTQSSGPLCLVHNNTLKDYTFACSLHFAHLNVPSTICNVWVQLRILDPRQWHNSCPGAHGTNFFELELSKYISVVSQRLYQRIFHELYEKGKLLKGTHLRILIFWLHWVSETDGTNNLPAANGDFLVIINGLNDESHSFSLAVYFTTFFWLYIFLFLLMLVY